MTDPRVTTICAMNFPLMRGEIERLDRAAMAQGGRG